MSDGSHSNAVRLQALALVVAALLTTTGAVTSAIIQSGWIKRPAVAVAMNAPQVAPRPQAMFTGGIEPLEETALAINTQATELPVVKANTILSANAEHDEKAPTACCETAPRATLQIRSEPSFNLPAIAPAASAIVEQSRTEAPRVLAAPTISKPLMSANSNWFSGIIPTIFSQPAQRSSGAGAAADTAKPRSTSWTPTR